MLFIYNPTTGGGRLKNKLMDILNLFSAAGYELSVWPTQAMGDARKIAQKRGGRCDILVCCGGDGTLNEVVDGIKDLPEWPLLGYVPGGTTCDFAASLELPKGDMLAAARRVVKPNKVLECDIGLLNGRAFTYVAAFGAFTDVSYKTSQKTKNVLGHFAYVLEGMQRLPGLESQRVRVCCNGEVSEGDYLLGMVTNSVSVAGFSFPNQRQVRMDDGEFEVLLVRPPQNLAELGELSASLLAGNISSPLLHVMHAGKVEMEFEKDMAWTLDGEFGGINRSAAIEVQQRRMRICV